MEVKERKPLSWKPRLQGEIYCSPACGGGCTKVAHDAAKKQASELAKQLGKGWKPHVWENLGWFAKAISSCGRIKVYHPDPLKILQRLPRRTEQGWNVG